MSNLKNDIVTWLRLEVKKANADGVVFGLSGGIDSAVLAFIAKESFPDNSLAIWININSSREANRNALRIAEQSKIKLKSIDLSNIQKQFIQDIFEFDIVPNNIDKYDEYINKGIVERDKSYLKTPNLIEINSNVKSRLRMITLYSYAQKNNYLVVGTSNAAERHVGYFTKHGDSASDLFPFINLTKREIYMLAKEYNINSIVMNQIPSADLYEGQTDEEEIGLKYSVIDDYLDGKHVSDDEKRKIELLHNNTSHKLERNEFNKKK